MARSPLFRALRRSLRLARLSGAVERPPGEVAQELREMDRRARAGDPRFGAPGGGTLPGPGSLADRSSPLPGRPVSRRHFLHASGAAMAGIGLAGCLPGGGEPGTGNGAAGRGGAPRSGGDPDVLIVGAGIAGLTAGWRLRQAGVPFRILEAQDRIGGRMYSLRGHFADGQVAELGGELIDTGHTAIRALARELDLELVDLHENETLDPELWHFGGRRIREVELLEAWAPVAARIQADLDTLHDLDDWPWATYHTPNGAEDLDHTPLSDWLERTEMEGWFRDLLEVGFTTEYGLEADRQSALNLHFMIDPDPSEFVIYGESDERFHVRGGNDRIPHALAERLEADIETGVRLEALRERADGRFELSVRSGASSRTLVAPRVVLALPFTLLRDVELDMELPAVKRRAIEGVGYGTNAKLMLGFRDRVWRERHGAGGSVLTDLPFQLTWETSREQPGTHGILTNFTGGDHGVEIGEGTAAQQARRAVGQLETVFPGIEATHLEDQAVRFHWPSHAWTRGSYATYLPGQWTSICGAEGEAVRGLHFAGEHTSLDAQGFMEGGCESGERVAREILAALGREAIEPAA